MYIISLFVGPVTDLRQAFLTLAYKKAKPFLMTLPEGGDRRIGDEDIFQRVHEV